MSIPTIEKTAKDQNVKELTPTQYLYHLARQAMQQASENWWGFVQEDSVLYREGERLKERPT